MDVERTGSAATGVETENYGLSSVGSLNQVNVYKLHAFGKYFIYRNLLTFSSRT